MMSDKLFPQVFSTDDVLDGILLAGLGLLSLVMIWYATRVWAPGTFVIPVGHDVQKRYDNFIAVEMDRAFNNAICDPAFAFRVAARSNEGKGRNVKHRLWVLVAQVPLLGVGIVVKLFR